MLSKKDHQLPYKRISMIEKVKAMGLKQLVNDYENAIGYKVKYREVLEQEGIVSGDKPAAVMGDGSIVILKGMETEILEEAIAHEVMHVILSKNIISCRANGDKVLRENHFDINEDDDFLKFDTIMTRLDALALSINGTLSHRTLVEELHDKYKITSHTHLTLISRYLDESEFITTCGIAAAEDLHAHGLVLFDLEQTMPELMDSIVTATKLHPEIEKAYVACQEHLLPITNGSDMINQHNRVIQFLRNLGYDPDILIVSNL
jgi:sulfur carrier protein ThiS